MFRHVSLILAVVLPTVTIDAPATKRLQPGNRSFESTIIDATLCKRDAGTIVIALQQLSSGDYNQTQGAKNLLTSLANHSKACRQEVVRALIGSLDQPNLDFEKQPSNYYLWREGSQLLGELKATEALDLLISHLDLTNGLHSASMVFQPAMLGVRQIGKAAIPKLALALQRHPKAGIRMAAAYCLTDIGGEAAMNALTNAQKSETNPCVANFIRISLTTFTYKSKNGVAFDNKAPQAGTVARQSWLMAFQCVE